MGVRESPAHFAWVDEDSLPESELPENERDRNLGWMLHDIDFDGSNLPHFFRAEMKNGVIEVPSFFAEEVKK